MLNFAESVLGCGGGSGWAGVTGSHIHLRLDPGPYDVGLAGELAAEMLVGLLFALLLQEGVVPLGHQLLHLGRAHGQGQLGGGPSPGGPSLACRWVGGWGLPTFSHLELMIWGVTVVYGLLPESLMWLLSAIRWASL